MYDHDPAAFATAIGAGDRRALARAITLSESMRPADRRLAAAIRRALPRQPADHGWRLGLAGPPGVGKSTFIEALGRHAIAAGHRVAVLAVDPSSPVSGGAILGDKTRMTELAQSDAAFVRPSPAGRQAGGVGRDTATALGLCEAAGFDVTLVETVGVGQSETAVADIVDMVILLLSPGGGDDLQGLKRGLAEMADLLVVNKSDLDPALARRTAADYGAARRLLRPAVAGWIPPVLLSAAVRDEGVDAVWAMAESFRARLRETGQLTRRRAAQARQAMWTAMLNHIQDRLAADPDATAMAAQVAAGRVDPHTAAETLLARLTGQTS